MDSAYYNAAVIGTIRRSKAYFSVTVPMNSSVRAGIAGIGDDDWTAIEYPQAIWDDQLDCLVSDAEVAEIQHVAHAREGSRRPSDCRSIVRRDCNAGRQCLRATCRVRGTWAVEDPQRAQRVWDHDATTQQQPP